MNSKKKIYLDNAATTNVDSIVKKEMDKYFSEYYGNPNSFHEEGLFAKNALNSAREKIAKILNCKSNEIIFTGGGTESINLAIKGIAFACPENKKHIITSKIEHPAVLKTCEYLERKGFDVTYLDVDSEGFVNLSSLEKAIRKDTFLVSIMYANNEIGTVQKIRDIGNICKSYNVKFHTDACQAAGYLDLNVEKLNVDLLSINASKTYGPKGVGLLYLKTGTLIEPLIHGGFQENGKRAGTENVPGIMGFSKALELAQADRESEIKRLCFLRDKLIDGLLSIEGTCLNGSPIDRLPNNVNVSFLDVEGEAILLYLDSEGIFASSGSACTSKTLDPSHVIISLGIPFEYAHGSIRFTLGKQSTEEDIDRVLEIMPKIIETLRKISPFKNKEILSK
jgi:cysteine desulfurase